jgi:hypothetical protein
MANVTFYDDHTTLNVPYYRVYCFDWEAFTEENWELLDQIFQELPGYLELIEGFCGRWFGNDETDDFFITGLIDRPGLEVLGAIQPHLWEQWDHAFRSRLSETSLPFYQCSKDQL